LAGGMTFAAQYGAADLRMEWNLVVLSAIVANDIEALRGFVAHDSFFRAAFRAALRGHHIALVEHFLFLFGKQKDLLTLHTRNFYIRHRSSPIVLNKNG
jgi:hypothetical protein